MHSPLVLAMLTPATKRTPTASSSSSISTSTSSRAAVAAAAPAATTTATSFAAASASRVHATAAKFSAAMQAAAQACADAIADLWTRCKRMLQRMAGHQDDSVALDANVHADEAVDASSALPTTTLVAIDHDATTHALEPTPEPTPKSQPEFRVPSEIAEHELVLGSASIAAYAKALVSRHAALGSVPVPSDTVLKMISCLLRQNKGLPFVLAYPTAIVDVVLRALAYFGDDAAAAYASLSTTWMAHYHVSHVLERCAHGLAELERATERCRRISYDAYVRTSGTTA